MTCSRKAQHPTPLPGRDGRCTLGPPSASARKPGALGCLQTRLAPLSPRRHSRRDCRSPPYPEAAKVAARNACGETKAGASRLTAFALLLANLEADRAEACRRTARTLHVSVRALQFGDRRDPGDGQVGWVVAAHKHTDLITRRPTSHRVNFAGSSESTTPFGDPG
jgi:hypothetical protein